MNSKENDIVQKGGGVSEKYQIMNVQSATDKIGGQLKTAITPLYGD